MKIALAMLTVLLVATPAASAKGIASAEVCGTGGCRALDAHGALDLDNLIPYGASVDAPRRLPFYRLRLAFVGPDMSLTENRTEPGRAVDVTYVPAAGVAHFGGPKGVDPWRDDAWSTLDNRALKVFRRATAGLEPLPAAELERAGAPPTTETAGRPADDRGSPLAPPAAGALALLAISGAALLASHRRARRVPRDSRDRSARTPGQAR